NRRALDDVLEPVVQRCIGSLGKLAFEAALATKSGKFACARAVPNAKKVAAGFVSIALARRFAF
ncbi:MAG TPA: hypothetical protein VEU06_11555, partial [Micropepsaceae bacterium]|nr:hypothetical protein [Micropepsaceae bacterium]